jgi:glycosyltransferase involved in cell wall biosynthesis
MTESNQARGSAAAVPLVEASPSCVLVADRQPPPDAVLPSSVHLLMVATVSGTLEAFIAPYARHFRSLGWRVDAAAHGAGSNPVVRDAFDEVYELPISRSLLDPKGLLRGRAAISEVLRSRPDIVHVHTPIAGFVTRLVAHQAPIDARPAVAYTAHGFHFHKGGLAATNALFVTVERLAGRWTDRLVVINEEDLAAAERYHIVPRRHLVRMPGIGVDTRSYQRSAVSPGDVANVREGLGVTAATPLFVVIGELNRNKRQRDAVAALATMRHAEAHLLLVGARGSQTRSLEQLVHHLGLRDRVHLLGFVHDVRPVVCAATALILPSAREGLARSVMEALALEVPVIASTARGNRELVGDDRGILFSIGDVRGLTEAMDRLIDQPEERRAMGLRGRARMVEGYDLQLLIRMHEALYQGMLSERSRRTT